MRQRSNKNIRFSLRETLFPAAVPVALRILAVISAVVLLTAGTLYAVGYFSSDAPGEAPASAPMATPSYEVPSAVPSADNDGTQAQAPSADAPETLPNLAGLTIRINGSVYVSGDTLSISPGASVTLELLADGEPVDADAVTWKSFDETILKLDGGTATALSSGETQCRATYSANNRSISINIIVEPSDSGVTTAPAVSPAHSAAPTASTPPAATDEPSEPSASPSPTRTPGMALEPVEPPVPETPVPDTPEPETPEPELPVEPAPTVSASPAP